MISPFTFFTGLCRKSYSVVAFRSERNRRMSAQSAASSLVSFKDFTLVQGGREVTVKGSEILALYKLLAHRNKVPLEQLLARPRNTIRAGRKLGCVKLKFPPFGKAWMADDRHYLMLKIQAYPTPRGVSYLGQQATSPFKPTRRGARATRKEGVSSSPPCTPPGDLSAATPSPRPCSTMTSILQAHFRVSAVQPLMIRLHRAAGLSASPTPQAHSRQLFLHICGNKWCGVVAPFRPGTEEENRQDVRYHQRRPGCARIAYKPLY